MKEIKGFYDVKNAELNIRLDQAEDVVIVRLTGDLNTYNSTFFSDRVRLIISAGIKKYVFDLSDLRYVSSTGIGAFTGILKDLGRIVPEGTPATASPGEMVLCGIRPNVYEIFQLLGFSSFFRVFDNVDSAMLHFIGNTAPIFPKVLICPVCSHKLRATKSGRFRCGTCKSIIIIDSDGKLFKE